MFYKFPWPLNFLKNFAFTENLKKLSFAIIFLKIFNNIKKIHFIQNFT